MFSGTRMWAYLIGSFVNALACSIIPLMIFQNSQSIAGGTGGKLSLLQAILLSYGEWVSVCGQTLSSVLLLWVQVVMNKEFHCSDGTKMEWQFCYLFCFCALLICMKTYLNYSLLVTILWIVQDELYDSLPIIIRSPVYYLQAILAIGIVFVFLVQIVFCSNVQCAKVSVKTAFKPEIWRPYAEQEVLEKKPTKTHPLDNIAVSNQLLSQLNCLLEHFQWL